MGVVFRDLRHFIRFPCRKVTNIESSEEESEWNPAGKVEKRRRERRRVSNNVEYGDRRERVRFSDLFSSHDTQMGRLLF